MRYTHKTAHNTKKGPEKVKIPMQVKHAISVQEMPRRAVLNTRTYSHFVEWASYIVFPFPGAQYMWARQTGA